MIPLHDHHAHAGHSHKHGQADHFDHIGTPEFEINRPHGESAFYTFLMRFKYRRAIGLLPWPLVGRRVLSICCGSGMDAEFLERDGATVIALDISQGALLRARERARTYGLKYWVVRGDAEHLPFRTGSVDVSFVHDGLHHLEDPTRAIGEMARVARDGVVITEPANAFLTNLLIALRIVPAREDSGNMVIRFSPAQLEPLLRHLGLTRFASTRYLVKYGHPPPAWWRVFDWRPTFAAARAAFLLIGVDLLGPAGNKLSVAAVREGVRASGRGARSRIAR